MASNSRARWSSARSSPRHSVGGDDERDEIDAPGLGRAGRIGEQIVGDAGLAHPGVELLHAQARGGVERGERAAAAASQCGLMVPEPSTSSSKPPAAA